MEHRCEASAGEVDGRPRRQHGVLQDGHPIDVRAVVDDDAEMLGAIGLMLRVIDCNATGFPGARKAAQALLAGERPDLMIVDINMPATPSKGESA